MSSTEMKIPLKIGDPVLVRSESSYAGQFGKIIEQGNLATRWMVLINGDQVTFDERELVKVYQ